MIVPTLRVGMPTVTLRVIYCGTRSVQDAFPRRAWERSSVRLVGDVGGYDGSESGVAGTPHAQGWSMIVPALRVGMQGSTLRDPVAQNVT